MAGILGKREIVKAVELGLISIKPYNEANLTNVAYEVTLGSRGHFVSASDECIDISDRKGVFLSWKLGTPTSVNGKRGITIPPHGSVLAHTNEFIGSTSGNPINTLLRGRSSLMRAGVSVSSSAGWGDIGFTGRWGLLFHNTRSAPVFIPFGMRVAQIAFISVTSANADDDYASLSGSYATRDDGSFEELDAAWRVESIL